MTISIVVPCFNEEESIPLFYAETKKTLRKLEEAYALDYEFIFVDDGSVDNTLAKVKELRESDERVRFISFSRNFGKEAGIYAGFKVANGDYVATMDVDLQDPPAMLVEMVRKLKAEGAQYDCVATRRSSRVGEPPVRSFFARMFYRLINAISETEIVDGARDYRLMTRRMVNAILSLSEYNRFSKGIFSWVGFKTFWLEYENQERVAGVTKWNFFKLFRYAVQGITDFTTAPLQLASWLGILFCLMSLLYVVYRIVWTLTYGNMTPGWSSLMCVILFCAGVQLLCLGVAGTYLAKLYMEVKNRPVFVVAEADEKTRGCLSK